MERYKEIERSIITEYRKKIWNNFIKGVREFKLVRQKDKIAVCISGGKDSMLMAKCMQELKRQSKVNFELIFLVMDPGYNEENMEKIIKNAKELNIPITIFKTNIFKVVTKIDDHPCYICSRMRRGHLYNKAKELGCNKIALGHHFDDVIETILMGMLYGAQVQTMMPCVHSSFHEDMELIRPMYYVKEEDIVLWAKTNNLGFIKCACKFTENYGLDNKEESSKRQEVKNLIKEFRKKSKYIDKNIFRSVQNVNLDTIISYKVKDKHYHFLDTYDKNK